MEPEASYGKRLRKAAAEDFRNFWSGHRIWVTVVTLAAPFITQASAHGLRSLLTLRDTLESAGLALGLSVAGNLVIAFFQGAKSLDAERSNEVNNLRSEMQALTTHGESIDPAEEHHYRSAQDALASLPIKAKDLLTHLWTIGSLRAHPQDIQALGMDNRETRRMLEHLQSLHLVCVEKGRDPHSAFERWEISPGYRNALGKLLFPK